MLVWIAGGIMSLLWRAYYRRPNCRGQIRKPGGRYLLIPMVRALCSGVSVRVVPVFLVIPRDHRARPRAFARYLAEVIRDADGSKTLLRLDDFPVGPWST